VSDDLPNSARLTEDQAQKVRAKTISNILKKIAKGGTPTLAEQKMLDDAVQRTATGFAGMVVGVKDLAEVTGYTTQRLDQLREMGVIKTIKHGKYDALECLKALFEHSKNLRRNQHDGDPSTPEGKGYEFHRARLTEAKADIAEIEAELKKGTTHAAEAVAAVWSDMIGNARAKLLALPTKLAGALDGLEITEREALIKDGVNEALRELADYSPEAVTGEWERRRQPMEEDEDEDEPDA
jgi:phage terminase Nu1 subunit (DNA packaging protein)